MEKVDVVLLNSGVLDLRDVCKYRRLSKQRRHFIDIRYHSRHWIFDKFHCHLIKSHEWARAIFLRSIKCVKSVIYTGGDFIFSHLLNESRLTLESLKLLRPGLPDYPPSHIVFPSLRHLEDRTHTLLPFIANLQHSFPTLTHLVAPASFWLEGRALSPSVTSRVLVGPSNLHESFWALRKAQLTDWKVDVGMSPMSAEVVKELVDAAMAVWNLNVTVCIPAMNHQHHSWPSVQLPLIFDILLTSPELQPEETARFRRYFYHKTGIGQYR